MTQYYGEMVNRRDLHLRLAIAGAFSMRVLTELDKPELVEGNPELQRVLSIMHREYTELLILLEFFDLFCMPEQNPVPIPRDPVELLERWKLYWEEVATETVNWARTADLPAQILVRFHNLFFNTFSPDHPVVTGMGEVLLGAKYWEDYMARIPNRRQYFFTTEELGLPPDWRPQVDGFPRTTLPEPGWAPFIPKQPPRPMEIGERLKDPRGRVGHLQPDYPTEYVYDRPGKLYPDLENNPYPPVPEIIKKLDKDKNIEELGAEDYAFRFYVSKPGGDILHYYSEGMEVDRPVLVHSVGTGYIEPFACMLNRMLDCLGVIMRLHMRRPDDFPDVRDQFDCFFELGLSTGVIWDLDDILCRSTLQGKKWEELEQRIFPDGEATARDSDPEAIMEKMRGIMEKVKGPLRECLAEYYRFTKQDMDVARYLVGRFLVPEGEEWNPPKPKPSQSGAHTPFRPPVGLNRSYAAFEADKDFVWKPPAEKPEAEKDPVASGEQEAPMCVRRVNAAVGSLLFLSRRIYAHYSSPEAGEGGNKYFSYFDEPAELQSALIKALEDELVDLPHVASLQPAVGNAKTLHLEWRTQYRRTLEVIAKWMAEDESISVTSLDRLRNFAHISNGTRGLDYEEFQKAMQVKEEKFLVDPVPPIFYPKKMWVHPNGASPLAYLRKGSRKYKPRLVLVGDERCRYAARKAWLELLALLREAGRVTVRGNQLVKKYPNWIKAYVRIALHYGLADTFLELIDLSSPYEPESSRVGANYRIEYSCTEDSYTKFSETEYFNFEEFKETFKAAQTSFDKKMKRYICTTTFTGNFMRQMFDEADRIVNPPGILTDPPTDEEKYQRYAGEGWDLL
ncbi:MAG: hypothetical protein Q3972_07410 [Corynebacterium sp.]|nr:hypothetical protein [Corynebacterium sp.]